MRVQFLISVLTIAVLSINCSGPNRVTKNHFEEDSITQGSSEQDADGLDSLNSSPTEVLKIISQPGDQNIVEGNTAEFSLGVRSDEDYTIRWVVNGVEIAGNLDSLSLENIPLELHNAEIYAIIEVNKYNLRLTSKRARLNVLKFYHDSCAQIKERDQQISSGKYQIDPEKDGYDPKWVYCDMSHPGDGVTLQIPPAISEDSVSREEKISLFCESLGTQKKNGICDIPVDPLSCDSNSDGQIDYVDERLCVREAITAYIEKKNRCSAPSAPDGNLRSGQCPSSGHNVSGTLSYQCQKGRWVKVGGQCRVSISPGR